jgi:hypothetical protein
MYVYTNFFSIGHVISNHRSRILAYFIYSLWMWVHVDKLSCNILTNARNHFAVLKNCLKGLYFILFSVFRRFQDGSVTIILYSRTIE